MEVFKEWKTMMDDTGRKDTVENQATDSCTRNLLHKLKRPALMTAEKQLEVIKSPKGQ